MHSRRGQSASPKCRPAGEPDDRRRVGRLGEELAAAHFQRLGFRLLARNVRTRHGEIDLIAFDGQMLVFVEVKTRRAGTGRLAPEHEPLAALRPRQRARLRRLAVAWLSTERSESGGAPKQFVAAMRFDAVGVVLDASERLLRLDHIESAW